VVGWGGVGQSYVMKKLGDALLNCIYDSDGEKHSPVLPKNRPHSRDYSTPTLYIYGDPMMTIQSHYRRNWANNQAHKISRGKFGLHHSQALPSSLSEYEKKVCKTQVDYFDFLSHAKEWAAKPNVVLMTLEDLARINFFDIKLKNRTSDPSGSPQAYADFYNKIYEEVNSLNRVDHTDLLNLKLERGEPMYKSRETSGDYLRFVATECCKRVEGDLVEIGCLSGTCTRVLAQVARKYGRKVWAVDPYEPGTMNCPAEDIQRSRARDGLTSYERFTKNILEPYADVVELLRFSSQDPTVIKRLKGLDISFAHVDGLHTTEACKTDILTLSHCGGAVAVDDFYTGGPDNKRHHPRVVPAIEEAATLLTEFKLLTSDMVNAPPHRWAYFYKPSVAQSIQRHLNL